MEILATELSQEVTQKCVFQHKVFGSGLAPSSNMCWPMHELLKEKVELIQNVHAQASPHKARVGNEACDVLVTLVSATEHMTVCDEYSSRDTSLAWLWLFNSIFFSSVLSLYRSISCNQQFREGVRQGNLGWALGVCSNMALLSIADCSGIKPSTLGILPLFASDRRNITIQIAPTVQ